MHESDNIKIRKDLISLIHTGAYPIEVKMSTSKAVNQTTILVEIICGLKSIEKKEKIEKKEQIKRVGDLVPHVHNISSTGVIYIKFNYQVNPTNCSELSSYF